MNEEVPTTFQPVHGTWILRGMGQEMMVGKTTRETARTTFIDNSPEARSGAASSGGGVGDVQTAWQKCSVSRRNTFGVRNAIVIIVIVI